MRALLGFSRVHREVPSSPATGKHAPAGTSLAIPDTPSISEPPSPMTREAGLASPGNFLRQCALRWPSRSGARALQQASGAMAYENLIASMPSAEDEEQLQLDVERSTVDGLEELYVAQMDEESLRAALLRLLRAWCCRHPAGYCQGMNFVAMVLLVVMHHAAPSWPDEESGHRAEVDAFWTFAAVMELILPSDFYAAPSMPGLQCDVRVLFELFVLSRRGGELLSAAPDSAAASVADESWRDILRLAAYKWFVPCYVNQLPLPTLLFYWDRLFLRHAPSDGTPPGLSTAHLTLALALLKLSIDEASEAMSDGRAEEGLGLGFNRLLSGALEHTDASMLVETATRFEISAQQLSFLRSRLADPVAGGGVAARGGRGGGEAGGGSGGKRAMVVEPRLSGVQAATLWLMGARRSESLSLRLLKKSMLLAPLQPPPLAAASRIPGYYPRLCSTCAMAFTAFLVWILRVGPAGRRGNLLTSPVRV